VLFDAVKDIEPNNLYITSEVQAMASTVPAKGWAYGFRGLCFDPVYQIAVVTNGNFLAVRPLAPQQYEGPKVLITLKGKRLKADEFVAVPVKDVAKALEGPDARNFDQGVMMEVVSNKGTSLQMTVYDAVNYPDIADLVKGVHKATPHHKIYVDLDLITKTAKALGTKKVALSMPKDHLDPVLIKDWEEGEDDAYEWDFVAFSSEGMFTIEKYGVVAPLRGPGK
jgi:hypothetical protein